MTISGNRSLKVEKLARIYDDEIAPVWGTRFGKMLLRNLAIPDKGQVLDISCGTGYPTVEILRRMRDGGRLIAIDASSAMLDVARRKIGELGPLAKKAFFRTESPVPKLSFADDVYDLVVCNLGLGEMPDLDQAVRDFSRVTKRGGEVRCTLPLAGTFQEFHDLYREVLIKHDKHEALERLDAHIARYPTHDSVEAAMKRANLVGGMEVEEFTLLFKSSREFFFAPVIEYGPLSEWKEIAGSGQEMQDVFWYIKEAIDAYFDGRPFTVTVKAGCLIGKKHDIKAMQAEQAVRASAARISIPAIPIAPPAVIPPPLAEVEVDSSQFEEVDTGLPAAPAALANGSVRPEEIAEAGAYEVVDDADFDIDVESPEEQALDAFIEGAKRPSHLG